MGGEGVAGATVTEAGPRERRKPDATKVQILRRLLQGTVVTPGWIAERRQTSCRHTRARSLAAAKTHR